MPRIPQPAIDDLLARTDIVEVIEKRIKLKKAGSNYQALCPFHQEKTPSFSVSPNKQMFYCFGCGEGGNVITFIMNFDRLSFIEAVNLLAQQAGIELPTNNHDNNENFNALYELMQQACGFYQKQLRHSKIAIDYLKQRGLTGKISQHFHIGYAPNAWENIDKLIPNKKAELLKTGLQIKNSEGNQYDRFRHRIMFPIHDTRGRIVGFGGRSFGEEPKYLNSPETPLFHKGQEIYGLYQALQANRQLPKFIIVEGYLDVIALAQHGITYAGATLGTACTTQHLHKLLRYTDDIIFCFDGDDAGRKAAWRALEVCLPVMRDGLTIRFLLLPQGQDPDTFIREHGKFEFEQRMQQAQTLASYFFTTLISQTDLQTISGKAKLAELVKKHLEPMPNGVYKELLLLKLTEIVGTDKFIVANKPKPTKQQNSHALTPMRTAIALLLQEPKLGLFIDTNQLAAIMCQGHETLKNIVQTIAQQPDITTAQLLEHWREHKRYPLLAKLASTELIIPAAGRQLELKATLEKLKAQSQQAQATALLELAKQRPLTEQERTKLQQLITKQQPEEKHD